MKKGITNALKIAEEVTKHPDAAQLLCDITALGSACVFVISVGAKKIICHYQDRSDICE